MKPVQINSFSLDGNRRSVSRLQHMNLFQQISRLQTDTSHADGPLLFLRNAGSLNTARFVDNDPGQFFSSFQHSENLFYLKQANSGFCFIEHNHFL